MKASAAIATFVFGSVLLMSTPAAVAGGYVVKRQHLACVLENLETYRASEVNPVLIFLERCPEGLPKVDPNKLRLIPRHVPELRRGAKKPGEPESVLALTKEELGCMSRLENLTTADHGDVVTLPANICDQP